MPRVERSVSHITAVLLLVLVAVGAALLIYLYVTGFRPYTPSHACTLSIVAVKELTNTIGGSEYGYAIRAWVSIDHRCGNVKIDVGYLEHPDGSLAAVLRPIRPVVLNNTFTLHEVTLYSDRPLPIGDYLLRLPGEGLGDPAYSFRLPHPLAGSIVIHGNLEEINGSVERLPGATVIVNVTVYEPQYDTYKVTVRVCAEPGHYVYYDRIMVLNATYQPPVYVGHYYVFVEQPVYLPFTYPDCSIADFYPVRGDEAPLTIIASAYTG